MSDYREEARAGSDDTSKQDKLTLVDVVYVLIKHRGLILGSGLAAAVLIVLLSIVTVLLPPGVEHNPMPNLYRSRVRVLLTWVEMESKLDSLGYDLGLNPTIFFNPAIPNPYLELINGLLYGNTTLDRIAEEFDLYERFRLTNVKQPKKMARERLKKAIDIEPVTRSNVPLFYIFEIGFIHTDPNLSVQVTSRIVQLLEESFRSITMRQILDKEEFIEQRLRLVEQQIEQSKNAIFAFQQRYGTIDLSTQSAEQNRLVNELRSEIIRHELEISNLKKYTRPNDARVVRLEDEIERKTQLISELQSGSAHGFVALEQIPRLQQDLEELEQNLKMQEELQLVLKKEFEAIKIEESNNLNNFQIIEAATVPEEPYGPNRVIICLLVTLTVLFLSVFWAFFKEYLESLRSMPGESDKVNRIRSLLSFRRKEQAEESR